MIWTGGCDPANPAYFDMAVMSLRHLDIVAGTPVPTVLNYTLINSPPGAAIDGNGIITWQPGGTNGPGPVVFTTVATDNGLPPLCATNSFTVTVIGPVAPPTIRSLNLQNDRLMISWDSVPGQSYRLQYCDSLSSTNWVDVTPDVTAAGTVLTITNALGSSPSRFFRLLLLP